MASPIGTATVKASSGLNVRKGAGTGYAKLGSLSNGTKVNYYGDQDGWLQIQYNSKTGYISKQYTSVTSGATNSGGSSSGGSSSSGKVQVTASSLNVRKEPNTNCKILGSLSNGKVVEYSGESNGWLKISYNGATAWISKKYTKAVSNSGGNSSEKNTSGNESSGGSNSAKTTSMYVTASSLNVRDGAGTGNKKLGTLENGAEVAVYSTSGNWAKIKYGSGYGWVCTDYLSSTKPSSGGGKEANGGTGKGLNPHTKNYKQYSDPWGPKMYSNHNDKSQTYKSSACGPTACASVIYSLADKSVTPYTLGQWALSFGKKYRTDNDGTAHQFVPDVCAKYGLACNKMSVADGVKKLQAGKYAVAVMGAGYWTTGGHYITPYASDGSTIYVDDPGHSKRPNGFKQSVSAFKKECKGFWVIG